MNTITIVPKEFIHQALEKVQGMLEKAMEHSHGDYSMEQARVFLVQGTHVLLLFLEDDKIVGANIYFISTTPSDRVFYINATGGKTTKEHMDLMFDYAKSIGCTLVKACCRKSVARLCRQRYNFKETYTMIERKL